jgi:hypothetical protein
MLLLASAALSLIPHDAALQLACTHLLSLHLATGVALTTTVVLVCRVLVFVLC